MSRTAPASARAAAALALTSSLQSRLVTSLEAIAAEAASPAPLRRAEWLRDGGLHGGGWRFEIEDSPTFDRASANVSQVHYDDLPEKRLGSATAHSAIIHPRHPRAPSMHTHVSWTELRGGGSYWRVMADLNPSIPDAEDAADFAAALRAAAPGLAADAEARGDRYFDIPALGRARGVYHFYLEGYATGDAAADEALARRAGEAAIDAYAAILRRALGRAGAPTASESRAQLEYHTLYLFQVLTLDRGTTSGLLVHDQNDVGILGSLPSRVDPALLRDWRDRAPALQRPLVDALIGALPDTRPARVDAGARLALAQAVRAHYRATPAALSLQASGDILPPTVANHR